MFVRKLLGVERNTPARPRPCLAAAIRYQNARRVQSHAVSPDGVLAEQRRLAWVLEDTRCAA